MLLSLFAIVGGFTLAPWAFRSLFPGVALRLCFYLAGSVIERALSKRAEQLDQR